MANKAVTVPATVVYRAASAMAAIIEESWCVLGTQELKAVVAAHTALLTAIGESPDYMLRDGWACYARDPQRVLKRGVSPARMRRVMQWSGSCTRASVRRSLANLGLVPWRGPLKRDPYGRFAKADK